MPLLTAEALHAAYETGTTNPIDVVEASIAAAQQTKSIFTRITAERARAEAARSAARWSAGAPLGPLDGIPVTWKDLFDVAGTPTTAASALLAHATPAAADATVVARATAAGMICLGKTNLSEFAFSGLGIDSAFGIPRNPALGSRARVPGGSSSGAAVSVASGLGAIAMGTDTAGSVRVPAAFNGLVSFRASSARYPMDGVFPLASSLDTLGPLAHSVRDCVAMDAVLRGDPLARDAKLDPDPLFRHCFVIDQDLLEDERVECMVRANLLRCLKQLQERGAYVERRRLGSLHEVVSLIDTHGWLGSYEAFALHRARLDNPTEADRIDRRTRMRLEKARGLPQFSYRFLLRERVRLMADFARELGNATLVLPTVAHTAPLLAPLTDDDALFATTNLATLRLTMLGSFLDTPAVALPTGVDVVTGDQGPEHLPTSLQMIRPRGDDQHVLSIALAVENALRTVPHIKGGEPK